MIVSPIDMTKDLDAKLIIFLQSGAPSAISDITPAAGWDILNCSSDTTAQTIRIICTGDGANCEHLNQNGAKDTLVRLPENVSNICDYGFFRLKSTNVSAERALLLVSPT